MGKAESDAAVGRSSGQITKGLGFHTEKFRFFLKVTDRKIEKIVSREVAL